MRPMPLARGFPPVPPAVIRAGRKAVPYAGPINYGWPKRHIRPRLFVNNGVASTESQWQKVYKDFIDKTLKQVKGK